MTTQIRLLAALEIRMPIDGDFPDAIEELGGTIVWSPKLNRSGVDSMKRVVTVAAPKLVWLITFSTNCGSVATPRYETDAGPGPCGESPCVHSVPRLSS